MNDLEDLRPSDAVRLLNSTRLREVVTDRLLREIHDAGGRRIGNGRRIHLGRYCAWLAANTHLPPRAVAPIPTTPPGGTDADGYAKHRSRMAKRQREKSESGRDIAPIPPVLNPSRRGAAERSFKLFCEVYLAESFKLAWSPDHLTVLARMEKAVLEGGLFAIAMPRGSGKTTIVEAAVMWAILYGHRRYIAIIGSAEDHAEAMLESIKSSFENNDLLQQDFPEVCYPIECLDRIANRANGQMCDGKSTQIRWGKRKVVLPTIEGSKASGSIIQAAGLTGQIRGMSHKLSSGEKIRPDFVIPDDPQTDESAKSPTQCDDREELIAGAVLGLAGPGKKIAGVMPCTVIRADDMADRILNRKKHPAWQGERMRMVYRWPTHKRAKKLWDEYAQLRRESLENEGNGEPATAFYLANQKVMDEGALVSWEARKNDDEASALQHAYNIRIDRGDKAFFAEYQNEPLLEEETANKLLDADEICSKLNRLKRGEVPNEASVLTAFVDIQKEMLVWMVVAWEQNFTGYVIDYGTFPDQESLTWSRREPDHPLSKQFPKAGLEGRIRKGLDDLVDALLEREFIRTDRGVARINRLLVDTSWGDMEVVVKQFCRSRANIVMPARGRAVGPQSRPFSDYRKKRGDRIGLHWRIPARSKAEGIREVQVDTNWWKSFTHHRLGVAIADPGAVSLFGSSKQRHEQLARHLLAERCTPTQAKGIKVDVWTEIPGRENDLFDCLVGCCVGASIEGVALEGVAIKTKKPPRKVSLSDLGWGG